jgi:hypothetical protein
VTAGVEVAGVEVAGVALEVAGFVIGGRGIGVGVFPVPATLGYPEGRETVLP